MRIDVIGRDIEITDAIREHTEAKADKLTRYFDGAQQISYTISKADNHHGYHIELVIDVEHSPSFVSSAELDDLYSAVDAVTQKGVRQLTDHKDKIKNTKR